MAPRSKNSPKVVCKTRAFALSCPCMIDICIKGNHLRTLALYAPSVRYGHLAYSAYGVGHTAWRQPGDMRGTVVGKKGRFRSMPEARGGDD